jgi:hypothetical protein
MQVRINTDSNIEGHDELAQQVKAVVEGACWRPASRVSSQSGEPSGGDPGAGHRRRREVREVPR